MASSKKLFILLPPSEGKALSGAAGTKFKESSGVFGKSLDKQRGEIINALRAARGGSPKLLGVSGAHLARAQAANLSIRGAKTLQARERYTGVVWEKANTIKIIINILIRRSNNCFYRICFFPTDTKRIICNVWVF